MSYRDTEIPRHGDTEKPSDGENEETEETEEVPPVAASVKTLQEAVQLALKDGFNKNSLFLFARAIKAFEVTHNHGLPPEELKTAFSLWWSMAKSLLPTDAEFDEYWFDFQDTFAKTKAALGSNSLQEAIRCADASPLPPQAMRFTSAKIKRLVAICFHLQRLQGRSPFFLGLRAVQRITDAKTLYQAGAMMAGLVSEGILVRVESGNRKRSTRYRFNLPESVLAPAADSGTAKPVATAEAEQTKPPKRSRRADAAKPPAQRTPTTYELVERKKALQDLIDGFNDGAALNYYNPEEAERLGKLKADLKQVNLLLAGVADDPSFQQTAAAKTKNFFDEMRRAVNEEP